MKWATRADVHIDRAASAWLIRRYIDDQAEFIFVADPADVPAEATAFSGTVALARPISRRNDSNGAIAAVRAVSGTTATDQCGTPNDSNGPLLLSGLAWERQQRTNAAVCPDDVVRTTARERQHRVGVAAGTARPGDRKQRVNNLHAHHADNHPWRDNSSAAPTSP